jgi:hypothetical protein
MVSRLIELAIEDWGSLKLDSNWLAGVKHREEEL